MSKNQFTLTPELSMALGMEYLQHYLTGDTITQIAESHKTSRWRVVKYMKKASELMVDAAQQRIFEELFPLALKSVEQHLQNEIAAAKEGKETKSNWTERIFKGMGIIDTIPMEAQALANGIEPKKLTSGGEGEEESSLSVVLRKRVKANVAKQLAEETVEGEVLDGGQESGKLPNV